MQFKTPITGGKVKTPKQIHRPNPFEETRELTAELGVYEDAEEKLKPLTFVQEWQGLVNMVTKLRAVYPPISILLDAMTGYLVAGLFATGLPKLGYYAVMTGIIGLCGGVSAILGGFKARFSNNIFKKNAAAATDDKRATAADYLKLVVIVAISIGTSALGGWKLSQELNDNTVTITAGYTSKQDSVKKVYAEQIAVYDDLIRANQATVNGKGNKWLKLQARTDMAAAQEKKTALLATLKGELDKYEGGSKADVAIDRATNNNTALWAAFVVCILELLYVFSYQFQYWFYKNAKTENANHGFIKSVESDTMHDPLTNALYAIANHMQQQRSNALPRRIAVNANAESNASDKEQKQPTRRIGFEFYNALEEQTQSVNAMRSPGAVELGTTQCDCCGEVFQMRTTWQRFCSKKCRMRFHNFVPHKRNV